MTRSQIGRRLLLAFILVITASAGRLSAQTVADFFVLLPDEAVAPWNETFGTLTPALKQGLLSKEKAVQEKALKDAMIYEIKVDTKNGYLTFASPGDGEGSNVYMTYWREKKKKDGPCVIAVVVQQWSVASSASSAVNFYRWTPEAPKKLEKVTDQYLPALHPKDFHDTTIETSDAAEKAGLRWTWVLPQQGTTIKIQAAEIGENELYDKLGPVKNEFHLEWNGIDFSLKKVPVKPQ